MTTYSFNLTLGDGEITMLRDSLKATIAHCEQKIEDGEDVPYRAKKDYAEGVLNRLFDNMIQTSGNNFFDGPHKVYPLWKRDSDKEE